ncbi:Disease resistance protein [Quillaja saponaria]|uniref:Disease resistance protein n=1 Tax=Quillaja saponaria TaxID=32244 RepID=A0AAD7L9I8_QUISA|nr:Disease resistance protein [Quillaja saponaria]
MMANNDGVSSTPGGFRLRWDVFLSFRGTDTRDSFTKNLYDSLHSNGVRVFRDDDGLDRGDEIAPSLLEAINDSAASIIIISPNYASSHWCLEELAEICDCQRLILPVFYGVDPSDVRKQKGPFEEAFITHEQRFEEENVLRWRDAMKKVGGVVGWVLSEEAALVQYLVKRVLRELSNTPVAMAAYTVGLEKRIEEVIQLLDLKSNGVKVVGLYGMGGVGKTTLAQALFNRIVGHFGRREFLSDVRKISSKSDGLVSLRDELKDDFSPVNKNRVLLVLDDVDDVKQLDTLIGRRKLLYEGSRIVITTRNRDVLVNNHVNEIYEVKELMSSDALKLFCHHALGRQKPAGDVFLNLSKKIVSLTGGLPLALEVFGSFLFDKRRIEEWEDALKKLQRIRPDNLQDVLKISFDGLDEEVKCVFLDLACLFFEVEIKREDVIDILRGCGFGAETAISVLTRRLLIKITEKNELLMHDQIRDMGRQIVRQEALVDPGMRSRLWDLNEIMTVLKDEKGTRCIQGIVLDFTSKILVKDPSGDTISWDNLLQSPNVTNALAYLKESYKKYIRERAEKEKAVIVQTKPFESMVNLRLLQINSLRLEGKFKSFPAAVKWLQWKGCPYTSMPSDLNPQDLAVLDLSESKIEKVWSRFSNKVAESLMVMNLSHCYFLVSIPDLSGCQILEKIVLESCIRLIKLHESVGNLSKLLHLNLRRCFNLIALPSNISGLKNLENLVLSGCSKFKEMPGNIAHMKSLKELLLDDTAIEELPGSIFYLEKLEILSLDGCQLLKKLPNCIGNLSALLELSLTGSGLEELPDSVGSLRNLIKLKLT